jgi:hypothetical protein
MVLRVKLVLRVLVVVRVRRLLPLLFRSPQSALIIRYLDYPGQRVVLTHRRLFQSCGRLELGLVCLSLRLVLISATTRYTAL